MSLVDDAACPFKSIDDIMVVEDVALKSEGVHVRGDEVSFEDFIKYHPKAVRKGDGAQRKGGRSVVSDDILRQLQVMFPWMSLDEIRRIASTNVACTEGHGKDFGGGGGSGGSNSNGQPCSRFARQSK